MQKLNCKINKVSVGITCQNARNSSHINVEMSQPARSSRNVNFFIL